METICPCGKKFRIYICRKDTAKYCSIVCLRKYRKYGQNKKPRKDFVCKCGKTFTVYPYMNLTAKFCSKPCQYKYRIFPKTGPSINGSLAKLGKKNPNWGKLKEKPSYPALHDYIRKRLEKTERCQHCNQIKKLDMSSKSRKYTRNLDDWLWLCRKCHQIYDGHINNLKNRWKNKKHI